MDPSMPAASHLRELHELRVSLKAAIAVARMGTPERARLEQQLSSLDADTDEAEDRRMDELRARLAEGI